MSVEGFGRGRNTGRYGVEENKPKWYDFQLENHCSWSLIIGSKKPNGLNINWSEHLWMCLSACYMAKFGSEEIIESYLHPDYFTRTNNSGVGSNQNDGVSNGKENYCDGEDADSDY